MSQMQRYSFHSNSLHGFRGIEISLAPSLPCTLFLSFCPSEGQSSSNLGNLHSLISLLSHFLHFQATETCAVFLLPHALVSPGPLQCWLPSQDHRKQQKISTHLLANSKVLSPSSHCSLLPHLRPHTTSSFWTLSSYQPQLCIAPRPQISYSDLLVSLHTTLFPQLP